MALPKLRQELALFTGPPLQDGQPTWTVQDPTRNQFIRLDWVSFEILSRWSLDDAQAIVDSVNTNTTLHIDLQDIEDMQKFLATNQLLQLTGPEMAAKYAEQKAQRWANPMKKLLHSYLFFRVPLFRPDRWLERLMPIARHFYTAWFVKLTIAVAIVGFVQVYRQWDQFVSTFMNLLSWEGVISIGLAIIAVKIVHEFGHAFTAKRYGCRVPAMGVAFLVLFPMAYTDTNEAWKLAGRKQRLAVASAGIVTELVIAVWATLAWALLPEGAPKAIAFLFATTTWVATLAINASPFLRFDGYFLLSDWLDLPNLHSRAFALARWHLREVLFNLGEPAPEHFPPRRQRGLIIFAWLTWLYRLVVFIGIAILVYQFFIKALGIILFIVEVLWFILLPVMSELKEWAKRWPAIRRKRRGWMSMLLVGAFVLLLCVPWPTPIRASALLSPVDELTLYAPYAGQLLSMAAEGSLVEAGTQPIRIASLDLQGRWQEASARVQRLRWQLSAANLDAEQRSGLRVVQQELAAAQSEWQAVEEEMSQHQLVVPFSGELRDLDPDLKAGSWVAARQKLGVVVTEGSMLVETYLDEETVRRVQIGGNAYFYADTPEISPLRLSVRAIDQDATRMLSRPMLSSVHGGTVMTREQDGQHIPEVAVFRVVLEVNETAPALMRHALRGRAVITGSWVSPAEVVVKRALALMRREAGF